MISDNAYKFCGEDVSLIENYEEAMQDATQCWDCHHRLETDQLILASELKEKDLYYNRPASELIFLTHSDHLSLHANNQRPETHRLRSEKASGPNNSMYGRHHSLETRKKQSESALKRDNTNLRIALRRKAQERLLQKLLKYSKSVMDLENKIEPLF